MVLSSRAVVTVVDERYYTTEEVAELLQVTPWTVTQWLKAGKLRGVQPGNHWRIGARDLARFLDSSANIPADDAPASTEPRPAREEEG